MRLEQTKDVPSADQAAVRDITSSGFDNVHGAAKKGCGNLGSAMRRSRSAHRDFRDADRESGGQLPMWSHTAGAFDADLETIRSRIFAMGGLVEQQIADAGTALIKRDAEIARSVIAIDAEVDLVLREVETRVVETIARRQPLAVDLREIVSTFPRY